MKNTAKISLEEYEKLKNGFENSELKKHLQSKIEELIEENKKIIDTDFFYVKERYMLGSETKYFRKDKTPLWIKKIFN